MNFTPKTIQLKNGEEALLRCPTIDDAATLLDYLRITAEETPFLLREPEECTMTVAQEQDYLRRTLQSPSITMLLCEVNGKLAGNCRISRHTKLKTQHRASIGIALMQEFWGLGIGTAMFQALIRIAREEGITQLELEVFAGNQRAIALYQKMGFRIVAEHPNAIRQKDGTLISEFLMIKELN